MTSFHEKMLLQTQEPPIRIEERPALLELQKLMGKFLYANGSWISDSYSWRTDGLPDASFDAEIDLQNVENSSEEIRNAHLLGKQKFMVLYRETWVDALEEMFSQLQRALLKTGPNFRWPTEMLRVDPPQDGESALLKLKELIDRHDNVLAEINDSEPMKTWIEETEMNQRRERNFHESLDHQIQESKRQEIERIRKITL